MEFGANQDIEINISPFVTHEAAEGLPGISEEDRRQMSKLLLLLNDRNKEEETSLSEAMGEAEEFMSKYEKELRNSIAQLVPGMDFAITHTLGVFAGTMEPAFKIEMNLKEGEDFASVNQALSGFAEQYQQVEYHASVVLDSLPGDRALNVLDPKTRTAFVSNTAFRYSESPSPGLLAKLHNIVASFAQQHHILGYTVIHPNGYDFYLVPEEAEASEMQNKAGEFNTALLELNTLITKALFSEDVDTIYQSNFRYLYIARRGHEYGKPKDSDDA